MRVVLDAYWWTRGTESLRTTVRSIVKTWSREYPEDELFVVVRRGDAAGDVPLLPNVRFIHTSVWPQAIAASLVVPMIARRYRADAMLSQNFAPAFGSARAVMLHDVLFVTNPEWFSRSELAYFRWMTRLVGRAQLVCATTKSEADRIRRFTRARAVVTVGFGLDPDLLGASAHLPVAGLVPGRFMLTSGRLNDRKNLGRLLEGVRRAGVLSPEHPVVLTGSPDGLWSDLPAWVADRVEEGSVRFLGFVSTDQVHWLMSQCSSFLCLSLDEGFGLPPVEARVLGAEVIVSDRAVFRETLGDTATFVDPEDPDRIAAAVKEARLRQSAPRSDESRGRETGLLAARHDWTDTVANIRKELGGLATPE